MQTGLPRKEKKKKNFSLHFKTKKSETILNKIIK